MHIFVTGTTGFIGSKLLDRLAQAEHTLVCLVRSPAAAQALAQRGFGVAIGDVTDLPSLRAGMTGCDAVLHLANVYSWWEPDPSIYRRVNVDGTRNVMEAALAARVQKVVHVSSTVVYGLPKELPFHEQSAPSPVLFSDYARSKAEGDHIAWELHGTAGLPLVVVYPSGVTGRGDTKATGSYVRMFIKRQLPAQMVSSSLRSWVHVLDVCEGIVRALEHPSNIGEGYILSGEVASLGDVNRLLTELTSIKAPSLVMPDWVALATARAATTIANLTKHPPAMNLAYDLINTMHHPMVADGSKATRELGLTYRPLRTMIEELLAAER